MAGQNGSLVISLEKAIGSRDYGRGGNFQIDNLFSGNNAPFSLVSYKLNEKSSYYLKYHLTTIHMKHHLQGVYRRSDLNLGCMSFSPSFSILASFMHGDALGLTLNLGVNPKIVPTKSGIEPAPMPILSTELLSKDSKLEMIFEGK